MAFFLIVDRYRLFNLWNARWYKTYFAFIKREFLDFGILHVDAPMVFSKVLKTNYLFDCLEDSNFLKNPYALKMNCMAKASDLSFRFW